MGIGGHYVTFKLDIKSQCKDVRLVIEKRNITVHLQEHSMGHCLRSLRESCFFLLVISSFSQLSGPKREHSVASTDLVEINSESM